MAFWKNDLVNVRVSERILWIGSEAYPLQNIARARTIQMMPQRAAAVKRFLKVSALWFFAGTLLAAVMSGTEITSIVGLLIWIATLALILWRLIELIKLWQTGPLYGLIIETSGSPRRGLVSPDLGQLSEVVERIMLAINNPNAEFQMLVQNLHVGDSFTMTGDHNVGKQVG